MDLKKKSKEYILENKDKYSKSEINNQLEGVDVSKKIIKECWNEIEKPKKDYISQFDSNSNQVNYGPIFFKIVVFLFKASIFLAAIYFIFIGTLANTLSLMGIITIPFQFAAMIHLWFTGKFPFWGKIIWCLFFAITGIYAIIGYFAIAMKMN